MRQALLSLDGVVSATVSYEDKRADVQYHPERVEPAMLIKAINDIGFIANEIDAEDEEPSP